jgi:hypothetical protein
MKHIIITDKNKWIIELLDSMSKRKEELRIKFEKRAREKFPEYFKN